MSPISKPICSGIFWVAGYLAPTCSTDIVPVDASDASNFFLHYYRYGAFVQSDRAWMLLDSKAKAQTTFDAFTASRSNIYWSELISSEPNSSNDGHSFVVHTRDYVTGGIIRERSRVVDIVNSESGVLIDRIDVGNTENVTKLNDFKKVVIAVPTDEHRDPWNESRTTQKAADTSPNGTLLALCQTDTSMSEIHQEGWWILTPQGWLASSRVEGGGAKILGIELCAPEALLVDQLDI